MEAREKNWTRMQMIKAIRRCSRELGLPKVKALASGQDHRVPLTGGEYQSWADGKNVPPLQALYQEFGGWSNASDDAGLGKTPGSHPGASFEEVKQALHVASRKWGQEPMGAPDFAELLKDDPARVHISCVLKFYGQWSVACYANEITPKREWKLSKEEKWLRQVRQISQERVNGRPMSIREFNRNRPPGFPSAERLGRLYGGWVPLQLEAGWSHDEIRESQIQNNLRARSAVRQAIAA